MKSPAGYDLLEKDYYPFGMLLSGRNWSSGSEYRYGFNGKEQDYDLNDEGNSLDFGARIYDSRLGRFFSVDPITKSFPMLSSYQYASNNPIFYLDIDGLEGVSYYEYTIVNGEKVILRRVVEIDVYIGVQYEKDKANSTGAFYVDPKKSEKFTLENEKNLEKEFNQKGLVDPDQNVPIEFRVNVSLFDLNSQTPEQKRTELSAVSGNYVTDITDGRNGARFVIMGQENIGKWAYNERMDSWTKPPNGEDGHYNMLIIGVNKYAIDQSHTMAHEISHFMVDQNLDPDISEMNDSKSLHSIAGGIFVYGDATYVKPQINPGGEAGYIEMRGTQNFNQGNVNQVLKSVMKIEDKIVTL